MKKRASVTANEQMFTEDISPLDYRAQGPIRRLSLIDTELGPPSRSETYFHDTVIKQLGSRGKGKKMPGAAPGTVAFIDYETWDDVGGPRLYIHYMNTRSDLRGKGYARRLLLHLMDAAEKAGVVHVDFGKVISETVWKLYREYREMYEAGASKVSVSGFNDVLYRRW